MKLTFPFEYVTTNRFGKVYRPYAEIYVFNKKVEKYVKRVLVVDSGADFTMFPRKDAFLFGINLAKETIRAESFGIGGRETIFLYKNLKIKIGNTSLTIPVGFLDRNDVPALLGRQQCLELLRLEMNHRVTTLTR